MDIDIFNGRSQSLPQDNMSIYVDNYLNATGNNQYSAYSDISGRLLPVRNNCEGLQILLDEVKSEINAISLENVSAKADRKKQISNILTGMNKGKSEIESTLKKLNCAEKQRTQENAAFQSRLDAIQTETANTKIPMIILISGIIVVFGAAGLIIYRKLKKK